MSAEKTIVKTTLLSIKWIVAQKYRNSLRILFFNSIYNEKKFSLSTRAMCTTNKCNVSGRLET